VKNRTRRQVHPQSRRVVLPTIEILEERRAPAAFIVTSAADTGGGTLRDAITQSNATDGPNTITFAIGSGGVQTITLASALPALTQPVSIFGGSQTSTTYTSPGIVLNGAAVTGDGFDVYGGTSTIEGFIIQGFHGHGVVLATNGSDEVINDAIGTNSAETAAVANTSDGVLINNVGSNAIQNCVISGNHFNGIEVTGASAASNLIGKGPTANDGVGILTGGGDLIGLNFSGTAAIANLLDGILIHNSANLTTMTSDVVSGNTGNGIHITGTGAVASGVGTTGNSILASYIGTNLAGTAKIGNGADGILIDVGANNNNIGDGTTANTNIISGNVGNGIHMTGSGAVAANLGTTGNTVEANLIGTDVTGKVALGNTGDGILLDGGANNNTIGAAGSVNVISANHNGVHITGMGAGALVGSGTEGNTLVGNYIGTDITGAAKLGNTKDGVLIDNGANSNTIGDGTNADANIISGNGGNGIHITGTGSSAANTTTTANLVEGNFIGTDLTGKIALGNVDDGVLLENGANYNAIGVSGSINVISANGKSGIEITGTGPVSLGVGTVGNSVITNYIGTDVTGAAALGNTADGVLIDSGANENTIGDGTTANANVISANLGNGVHISGLGTGNSNANIGTQQNTVEGNLIGTDFTGTVALGNINDGVLIDTSANNNSIGSDGTVNVISGNHNNGVEIAGIGQGNPGTGTQGNTLLDNYIGTDITGEAKLGNTGDGVVINNGANGNTIGDGSADGINVIAGNGGNGIHMDGSNLVLTNGRLGTVKNSVLDNYIGTDLTGGAALGNTGDGILVNNGASGNTIGSDSTANVISGNVKNGIEIAGATTTGNTAIGNFIGVDATGALALGNTLNGVLISTGANANKIGDDNVGGSNIISANGANGVYIAGTGLVTAGTGTTGNVLLQNYIGTDSTGHFPLGNTAEGVLIDNGANANKIGDGTAGGVNVIAANTGDGIHLDGSGLVITTGKVGTENNVIAENYIGLDVSASVATGNGGDGILIDHGATNNTIGSATSHNVISGNTKNGVHITGTGDRNRHHGQYAPGQLHRHELLRLGEQHRQHP